jgi:TetR/AcrR family transcriptional regulator, acrAB operon repressor
MARKTKGDAELTYAALLDAAEQVFFEKGVSQTTLSDIATTAGLTRGAIYWHFKDKAALLHALFDRATLPMEAMLADMDDNREKDPLGALRHMCTHALCQLAQSPQQQRIFGIMFHKCESVGEVAYVMGHEMDCRDECLGHIEGLLQKCLAQGLLPADTDVFLSMQVIHNFMMGTMHQWLLATNAYDLEQVAPALVDMVLSGLVANPPRLKVTAVAAPKKLNAT